MCRISRLDGESISKDAKQPWWEGREQYDEKKLWIDPYILPFRRAETSLGVRRWARCCVQRNERGVNRHLRLIVRASLGLLSPNSSRAPTTLEREGLVDTRKWIRMLENKL